MKNNSHWEKLTALARQAPAAPPAEVPFGFAQRIAARALAAEPMNLERAWEFLSLRSLAFAAVLMVLSLSINYDFLTPDWTHDLAVADRVFETILEP